MTVRFLLFLLYISPSIQTRLVPNITDKSFLSGISIRDHTSILLLLVLSVVLVLPIALWGVPENFDLPQHLRFARTYHQTLLSGELVPTWAGSDNLGFGSVGIRFYPPLNYLLMSVLQFGTDDWYDTVWISIAIWMLIGCIGTYLLAKEWLSNEFALGAAVLYAVVPYHLIQVYQAFLLAEFAASAILPFCFLYAWRIITYKRWKDTLRFSLFVSLLILTHIPSTIIGTLSLGVFVLFLVERSGFFRVALRFIVAGLMTLAATSFFWMRFLTEVNWVKHNSEKFYGSGSYNYATSLFPTYFSAGDLYVTHLLWMWDIIIGISLLLLLPVIYLIYDRIRAHQKVERYIYAILGVGLFAFFMASSLSAPLWHNIPTLQKLQFPWRWLSVASLAGSLSFVIAIFHLYRRFQLLTRPFAYTLAMIITAIIVFDVTQAVIPSAPVPRSQLVERLEKLDSEPGCECWWPIWANAEALKKTDKVIINGREATVTSWEDAERGFRVEAGAAGEARVATFYYPHWRAVINGNIAPITTGEDGTIRIALPDDEVEVELSFREPGFVLISRFISLFTWIGMLTGIIALRVRTSKPQ